MRNGPTSSVSVSWLQPVVEGLPRDFGFGPSLSRFALANDKMIDRQWCGWSTTTVSISCKQPTNVQVSIVSNITTSHLIMKRYHCSYLSRQWWRWRWWWWFSVWRQVHWLLCHLGMRWGRWFPVAFLTDNYGWAICPRSLRSGLR